MAIEQPSLGPQVRSMAIRLYYGLKLRFYFGTIKSRRMHVMLIEQGGRNPHTDVHDACAGT